MKFGINYFIFKNYYYGIYELICNKNGINCK